MGSSGDTTASSVVYDALYRIKTLRDASNNPTTYSYDALGHIAQIAYPGADGTGKDTLRYTSYDASGLLLQSVDGRGHVANYTYNDAEGQLTQISYPSSSGENVSYAYDAYGLPQSVSDGTGTRTYTLNSSDVLAQVSTVFKKLDGTLTSAKNISYTYNADGSRASMTTPAGTFSYGHDALGRWTGLQDHQGGIHRWTYDALSRMTRQTLSNGVYTNYSYNQLSQLTGLTNLKSDGGTISKFGHDTDPAQKLLYDGVGNLKREVAAYDPYDGSHFFAGTTNYSYDNKDQLLNELSTRNGGLNNSFGYDAIGNPVSWKGQVRTFNPNNQETTGGTTQFSYDGNGNATTYKGYALAFNENDKMTRLTNPGGTVLLQAGYRADGLRGWKNTTNGTTYFLYDGSQLVCEFDGNGSLSNIDVWGANGLLGRQRGANGGTPLDCYAWDDRGNIAAVLGSNSAASNHFNVSAYGDVSRLVAGNNANEPYFGLGGQYGNYGDVETGLTLCGQRYYDASAGRWINRDPISYAGGLNIYGYVGNNPVSYADPSGLLGIKIGNGPNIGWGDPTLEFSRESWDAAKKGYYAGIDGLSPLGDPYKDMGYYDPCEYKTSWRIGKAGQIAIAAATAGRYAPAIAKYWGKIPQPIQNSIIQSGAQGFGTSLYADWQDDKKLNSPAKWIGGTVVSGTVGALTGGKIPPTLTIPINIAAGAAGQAAGDPVSDWFNKTISWDPCS